MKVLDKQIAKKVQARLQEITAAPGSMIHEGGVVTVKGTSTVEVDSATGKWTLAFMPSKTISNLIPNLNGSKVTCMYQHKA